VDVFSGRVRELQSWPELRLDALHLYRFPTKEESPRVGEPKIKSMAEKVSSRYK
jgi:hypothetical protein